MQRARLFVALWPDESVREALHACAQALHKQCGGRAVPRENLHITLAFLGDVPVERLADIGARIATPQAPAFALEFGRSGYWRHNRIAWAAPYSVPAPLLALVGGLRHELAAAGLPGEERAYAAHVTLIRDARSPRALPELAFRWDIAHYALVLSKRTSGGSRYEVVSEHKLGCEEKPHTVRPDV